MQGAKVFHGVFGFCFNPFFCEDSVMLRGKNVRSVFGLCFNPFFCEDLVMLCGKNVRSVVCVLLAVVGLAFCTGPAGANVISPLNGSFEADNGNAGWSNGALNGVTPTDWQNSALTSSGNTVGIVQPGSQSDPSYATPANGVAMVPLQANGSGWGGACAWCSAGSRYDGDRPDVHVCGNTL